MRRAQRAVTVQAAAELPEARYRIVYADPPWAYSNNGVINDDCYGHAARHYPAMSIAELCALPVKDLTEKIRSIVAVPRTPRHSEKPERFRQIIDELYPRGRRIELFARRAVPGWDAWGNETPGSSESENITE